jgi:hypothetical protein
MTALFWELDTEGNPHDAQLWMLKSSRDGWAHMTFDWGNDAGFVTDESDELTVIKVGPHFGELDTHAGKLRQLKWPRGVTRQAHRVAFGDKSELHRRTEVSRLSADEIKSFPAEPCETFSVDEVRAMAPFCGVYFAYNDDGACHYVGESRNVASRVSKCRGEIGDRRIGVIKCEPHERKRIEAFYVAMLDPPGNAISTHRMLLSESRDKLEASR